MRLPHTLEDDGKYWYICACMKVYDVLGVVIF